MTDQKSSEETNSVFAELLKEQNQNTVLLQQAISNYKKSPLDRKTSSYIKKWLQDIDELWKKFQQLDNRLRNVLPEEHSYFEPDVYKLLGTKYSDIRTKMLEEIENIQRSEPRPSNAMDGASTSNSKDGASTSKLNDGASTSKAGTNIQTGREDLVKLEKTIKTVQGMLQQVLTKYDGSTQFYNIKLKAIEQHWKYATMLHEKLWTLSSTEYDFDKFIQVEEHISNGIIEIHERISHAAEPSTSNNHYNTSNNFKLPKIELPKFDGNYLKWRNFHDLFSELVDKTALPLCQKLLYLKSSLSGEAAGLVHNYDTTAANYDIPWKTLQDRYENKRVLVNTLLKKLISQPISTVESVAALKLFHDTTNECLRSLNNLSIPTDQWDPIISYIIAQKLHKTTHMLWEQSLEDPQSLPNLAEFLNFIKLRFQALEAMGSKPTQTHNHVPNQVRALGASITTPNTCVICQGTHKLYGCPTFLKMTPKERLNKVQKLRYCVNCLRAGHTAKECKSSVCTRNNCNKKHNTLLHLETNSQQTVDHVHQKENLDAIKSLSSTTLNTSSVLLSTVCIMVTDATGRKLECRALLDSGSQANFISKQLAKKLGVQSTFQTIGVEGIGQTQCTINERINVEISSTINGFVKRIEAHILPKIMSTQPTQKIDTSKWDIPANIRVSDIHFAMPNQIDMLLGAGIFYSILSVGQLALGPGLPTLQNTLFGWVVGGEYEDKGNQKTLHCGIGITSDLNDSLEKFWKLEEFEAGSQTFTANEQRCENHFLQHARKHTDGRYIVKLPFEINSNQLGDSRDIALQRFKAIERRLHKDPQLRNEYIKFMREYEALNHMQEIGIEKIQDNHYFLPHHAVFKSDSTTTKMRVVFDASAKTSTNYSLNDILATGPTVQADVFTILLRFRLPRFTFTADIEKMYRQIWVHEEDRKFQLIWWRESPSLPLRCMQLSTVTYGTTCAPYLATRTLQLLAETNKKKYPLAAQAIKTNFYVDDALTGSDKITTALTLQTELRELLESAGLHLRKWCANDLRLLNDIPENEKEVYLDVPGATDENIKAMGIKWFPKKDVFSVKITKDVNNKITKRIALAEISRLFDPLGLVAPVVVTAKIFLQQLWKLKLDWDASLPQELHSKWARFRQELECLQKISIPRHIFDHRKPKDVQLHIFADASEVAYGAAAYVRTVDFDNIVIVRLLCSKSRVAPVKQMSLPRLELCAAKLATDLFARLKQDKILYDQQTYYWTDSTVVLGWIRASSANYHTFVANRISAIQQVSSAQQWHHVRTNQNPADFISRGVMPDQLMENALWFYGPIYLHAPMTSWPLQPPFGTTTLELRQKRINSNLASVDTREENIFENINHKNCLYRFQRIVAYVERFCKNVKNTSSLDNKEHQKNIILNHQPSVPSAIEMKNALQTLIKTCQTQCFSEEVKDLKRNKTVHNNSNINSLSPFLDEKGVIRIGGRLEASNLSYDAKHPVILPYHHSLPKLIFETLHKEHLHVGAQTLLSIVRQRFWPLKGKNIARSTIQGCVTCTRAKPKLFQQLMGALPKDRVQPARPFVISGVDFFGPISVHLRLRGKQPLKSYVAVFCCFTTKAVHLELVSDLSTDGFIGALRRFMARRGHCNKLYCDNATNFVGAKNQLTELKDTLYSNNAQEQICNECNKKNIQFSFIPPRAPHFGGLWEAAVKSAKHLLQSSIAAVNLTREEMETLLAEAEAIMNSRPLTPMSSNPDDLTALTPGHFLIGEPLTTLPDPQAQQINLTPSARWKLINHLKMEFWKRWTNEYLHCLQHRYKWKKEVHDITPNTMVLIKDDNLPSLKWSLGRIKSVIRGDDGLVRVADVQTSKNIIRRPITKLAPLPIEIEQEKSTPVRPEPEETPRGPKSKRPKMTSTLATIALVTLFILPICLAANVERKPFKSNPGIYFEKLGSANIITSEWNIVTYINISSYWKWNNRVKKFPNSLAKICNISRRPSCVTIVSLINHLVDELEMNNQLLQHKQQTRNKRGAFNIIGNVANSLFGVLDESYAKDMANTIGKIQQNEENISTHLQQQKSFLDNTLNILKKEQGELEREFNHIEKSFHALGNEIQQEKVLSEFNDLALQTILIITYLQRIQDSMLEVLTDSHHGKINPELISPNQMEVELRRIKISLPSSLKLPITSDVLKIFKIMNIEARILSDLMIFNIKIPLVATDQFEILKLTAVPWSTGGVFKQIKTNYTFLIINLHRDEYFPLKEKWLRTCTLMESENYLCQPDHAIYLQGSPAAECEVSLLGQAKNSSLCPMETIGPGPHWVQLSNPNSWIYAVDNETVINTVCENHLTKITLVKTGLLRFYDNCEIKQPLKTIRGFRSYNTSEIKAYIPDIDVYELSNKDKVLTSSTTTEYINNYANSISELDELQQKNAFDKLPSRHNLGIHDIHHYSLGYICLTIIIILCYITWKWNTKRKDTTTPPNAATETKAGEIIPEDDESRIITINVDPQ